MKMLKALLSLSILGAAVPAAAQDFPTKTITMVVPFSAGGPADTIARLIGQSMSETLKQSIIIENVLGVGGTLGAGRVAKAEPDGHTLLLTHVGLATSPSFYENLPFDPAKDLQPIGLVTDVPMTLVAKKSFPAKDLKELVSHVKSEGEKILYGNVGLGSASHLCGLLFMGASGTQMTMVPYKGGAPALNDLMAGNIDVYCEPATGTTPQIQAGNIKGYAVTTEKRVSTIPDIPTSREAGLPEFDVTTWYGMYAPSGTPKPIVEELSAALQQALKDPNVVSRFAELSMEPVSQERATPAYLESFLKKEIGKWAQILKDAGIKPQ